MLHCYTIWCLMRKYTNRQIQEEGVVVLSKYLEKKMGEEIKTIVEESEKRLEYNGTKNQRITAECIESIINNKYNYILSENKSRTGGEKKERKDNILQLPNNEVIS